MSRLLRFNESGRADLVVHLTLGAAAVAAAVICLRATFDFASGLDRIAERLLTRPAPAIYATPNDEPRNSYEHRGLGIPTGRFRPDTAIRPVRRGTSRWTQARFADRLTQ